MSTPRKRRAKRTKQAILDAARALIIEQGVEAFSLREVARRVDYSPAGLYEYFSNKDDLLQTIMHDSYLRFIGYMASVPFNLTPYERLVEVGMAYLSFAADQPDDFMLIFRNAKLNDVPSEINEQTHGVLVQAIEIAIGTGAIRPKPNYDVEEIAFGCWSLVHGMAMLQLTVLTDRPINWKATSRTTIEMYLSTLRPNAPTLS